MPQIDTPLLLDVLLGLVVLLFVPFGIRRGVAKEAMVSAAILLGALLATRFGPSWAESVGSLTGLDENTAAFLTSLGLLMGTPLLLGYGGGVALGPTRPGVLSRLTGGVLAAFNGVFMLSTILIWIERDFRPAAPLDEGVVSTILIRRADDILLGTTIALVVVTFLGWVVRAARARREPGRLDVVSGAPQRQRPVGAGSSADPGKHEPIRDQPPPTGRFAPTIDATSPLPAAGGALWSARDTDVSANGQVGSYNAASARAQANGSSTAGDDQTVWMAWGGPSQSGASAPPWPVAATRGVTEDERCAICRAQVGPRDVFCPECGATL